eukprot:480175_1
MSTSFMLLTCINTDDGYFHFYDARQQCFGFIWSFAFILIVIICTIFIVLWYFVFKQSVSDRENESNQYRSLVNKFASKSWYWENIMFIRRFGIALLTAIYYLNENITNILLISFLIILLCLQIKFHPFKYKRANLMETICLFGLISIIVCLNFIDNTHIMVLWYLSFLIFSPFIIVCIMILFTIYRWYKFFKTKNIDFNKEQIALYRIQQRMPISYKKWFEQELKMKNESIEKTKKIQAETIVSDSDDIKSDDILTKDIKAVNVGKDVKILKREFKITEKEANMIEYEHDS